MRSSALTALPFQRMAEWVTVKRAAHVSLFGYWSIWRLHSTYAGAFSQCTRTWSLWWDVRQCCSVGFWWMMISAGANYTVCYFWQGLLPSLDVPHHVHKHEWSEFREGDISLLILLVSMFQLLNSQMWNDVLNLYASWKLTINMYLQTKLWSCSAPSLV